MTDNNTQYLSQDKLTELQAELKRLKQEIIPKIAKRIDDARQMGDLSENAEYHSAREEMSWAQTRVQEVQAILNTAELISDSAGNDLVSVGNTIEVEINDHKKTYTIVGAQEADPLAGKISNESPLGNAFLGMKKGDIVKVEVPAGVQMYKILKIL